MRRKLEYLGHLVCSEGIRPLESKIAAVKQSKRPASKTEVKSFLGLLSYYRKFIPSFVKIARLLHSVSSSETYQWGPPQEEAWLTLKNILTEDMLLKFPDYSKPFILSTDASNTHLGCVPAQETSGRDLPICYYLRCLRGSEIKYSTYEKEALACV